MIAPGLYLGKVMHRRLRAPAHRFCYDGFWVALDLDALPETAARLALFSFDRGNLFAFFGRDHADGKPGALKPKIAAKAEGVDVSGRMVVLCTPRLLGFGFNPLSVYFCHDAAGRPSAVAWEVSNTFGARHTYIIAVNGVEGGLRQSCDKRLHVSPFLDMGLSYQFRVEASADAFRIGIVDRAAEGPALFAAFAATRRELTDAALLRLALRAPLAGLKVMAAIYWEALRLWLKGAKFQRAPAGSERPVAAHAASIHRAEANRGSTKPVSAAAE